MKKEKIKQLSGKEMRVELEKLRKELLNLRMRKQTGQVEKPSQFAYIRRKIARYLTALNKTAKETPTEKVAQSL